MIEELLKDPEFQAALGQDLLKRAIAKNNKLIETVVVRAATQQWPPEVIFGVYGRALIETTEDIVMVELLAAALTMLTIQRLASPCQTN